MTSHLGNQRQPGCVVARRNSPTTPRSRRSQSLDVDLHPDATTLKGTPLFIAPEVYDDPGRSGPAADLYALGVTLYTLLCGRAPFAGRNLGEVRANVLRANPRLPQEIDLDVPEPLQRICLKAMEADPDDRYESAEAMADDLRRFLGDREVLARPRRYQVELHGRLRTQLSDIRLWHEQKLIETPDMDRLLRPYHWLLSEDSPWRELSRRFPWETFFLRLGGWLVLLASVLWPAFYWDQLDRTERVASVALPTLLLNFAGWFSHRLGFRFNAIIFLTGGALLLPVLVAVVLSEYVPTRCSLRARPRSRTSR